MEEMRKARLRAAKFLVNLNVCTYLLTLAESSIIMIIDRLSLAPTLALALALAYRLGSTSTFHPSQLQVCTPSSLHLSLQLAPNLLPGPTKSASSIQTWTMFVRTRRIVAECGRQPPSPFSRIS